MLLINLNIPWHSGLSAAFAYYFFISVLLAVEGGNGDDRTSRELLLHLTVGYSGLLLGKPNTTIPAILVGLFCLAMHWKAAPRVRSRLLILALPFLAAVLLDTAILHSCGFSLPLMIKGYLGLNRTYPSLGIFFVSVLAFRFWPYSFLFMLPYVLLLPSCVLLLRVLRNEPKSFFVTPQGALLVGATLVSFLGLSMNIDFKITDAVPLLFATAVAVVVARQSTTVLKSVTLEAAILLMFFSILLGALRIRMMIGGEWAGKGFGPLVRLQDPFFGNLRARREFASVLDEVDQALQREKTSRVFFATRMEFLYARNRITPPLHLPLWWHPGSSYAIRDEAVILRGFEQDNCDLIISNHSDLAQMPESLVAYIHSHYRQVDGYSHIDVFRKAR